MKKLLSFCVYGDDPKYTVGMKKNIELCPEIYGEDWKVRIYLDNSVPLDIIAEYKQMGAEVIDMTGSDVIGGMFWRFLPFIDESVGVFCVRDADSRLTKREKVAVDEWIDSKTALHVMRDHPHHNYVVLGGMFGFNNNISRFPFLEEYKKFIYEGYTFKKMEDMLFLRDFYRKYSNNALVHDINQIRPKIDNNGCFFDENEQKRPFPTEREGYEFVGEIFNENNEPSYQRGLLR